MTDSITFCHVQIRTVAFAAKKTPHFVKDVNAPSPSRKIQDFVTAILRHKSLRLTPSNVKTPSDAQPANSMTDRTTVCNVPQIAQHVLQTQPIA